MSARVPIVVVMGATGTGKSKLAIQLAQKFNGEIISADSMQVYRGLDIASNKVTKAERAAVPHHMLDICRPMDRFTVMDFRRRTLPIIDDILKRRKLPIIVGGTDYYIESILFESLTAGPSIEADELVEEYCHVISAPELVNKWQTFEASVPAPTSNEEMSSEVTSDRPSSELEFTPISVDTVTQLADRINRLVAEFRECVQTFANELNVNTSMYLQTFYPLPGSSRADHQIAENNQQAQPLPPSFNFVDAESALLNYYLHSCLQTLVSKLVQDDDNWQPDRVCRELVSECWDCPAAAVVINKALTSKVDVTELLARIRELSTSPNLLAKCHESISLVYDNLKKIMEIRMERLKLLRISDDHSMIEYSNDQLYRELKLVDSKSFEQIHPNNRRKIIRALQIYFQEGIRLSEFLEEQHRDSGDGLFAPPRFPEACLLWLTCNQDILSKRLKERVDEMMEEGLIEELEKFHEDYNIDRLKHNIIKADYTKGIFQSIGLKEFHTYLMLSPEEKSSRVGEKALRIGIHHLKGANVRYSKTQYRRVNNRYVAIPSDRDVPPIFKLDCSDLEQWNEKVKNIAFDIVDAYLLGEDLRNLKHAPVEIEEPDPSRFEDGKFTCDICDRIFIGKYQWNAHYTSKGHRKQLYQSKVREFQKKLAALGPTISKEPDDTIEYEEMNELFG